MKNFLSASLTMLATAVSVTGCITPYQPPADTPTATLRFATQYRPVLIQVFEDTQCKQGSHGVRLKYISASVHTEKNDAPVNIEAEREIVLSMKSKVLAKSISDPLALGLTPAACIDTIKFIPKADSTYEVHFSSTPNNSCKIDIFRASSVDSKDQSLIAEASVQRVENRCWSISN